MAAPGAVFLSSPCNTVGEWLSLVEHLVRDQGVGGSNPLSPTNYFPLRLIGTILPHKQVCVGHPILIS